jgi:hypothetical protein
MMNNLIQDFTYETLDVQKSVRISDIYPSDIFQTRISHEYKFEGFKIPEQHQYFLSITKNWDTKTYRMCLCLNPEYAINGQPRLVFTKNPASQELIQILDQKTILEPFIYRAQEAVPVSPIDVYIDSDPANLKLSRLDKESLIQEILRNIPEPYYPTGEFREPEVGETFLYHTRSIYDKNTRQPAKRNSYTLMMNPSDLKSRIILKERETPAKKPKKTEKNWVLAPGKNPRMAKPTEFVYSEFHNEVRVASTIPSTKTKPYFVVVELKD